MSNLDRGARQLDEYRARRLMLPSAVDFDEYMNGRGENHQEKVKSPSSFKDELEDHFQYDQDIVGDCLPWAKTHSLIRFRTSELTIWNGINGHGKSQLLGQVMLGIAKPLCIASLEMRPVSTLARMVCQDLGGRFPTNKFIGEFIERFEGNLWLYDQQGTVSADRIISVIYYAAEKLGCKHFVVDSLMKCGMGEDDYNGQKRFVDRLCAVAKDTLCHVHLVTHARKSEDEYTQPGKMSVKGSGSITDQADNVITVWRNKKKEHQKAEGKLDDETKPDTMIICDKQRNGDWEGRIALWYDAPSMRWKEHP